MGIALDKFSDMFVKERHKEQFLKNNPSFYKKALYPRLFFVIRFREKSSKKLRYLKIQGYKSCGPWGTEYDVDYNIVSRKNAVLFDTANDAYQETDAVLFELKDVVDINTVRILPVFRFKKHQFEEYNNHVDALVSLYRWYKSEWECYRTYNLKRGINSIKVYFHHPLIKTIFNPIIGLAEYLRNYYNPHLELSDY